MQPHLISQVFKLTHWYKRSQSDSCDVIVRDRSNLGVGFFA